MAISTFMRKEIKFMLSMEQYEALLGEIHKYMDPDQYCVGGKEYGIYNLYYDTPDDYLIRTSLEKPYYKEKIRLRSYFSPAAPSDKVFLEIKKKVGGIVTKRRVTMTLAESDAYLLQRQKPVDLTKYLQKQIFSELDVFLDNYPIMPKQYISYQRSAFFGKDDPDFRLTFDRQITERRVTMTLEESDAYLMQRKKPVDLSKYLQKQIFSEMDVFLQNYPVVPKQYISYQRSAFFGKDDPDFRLTFDREITERRYDLSLASPSYGAQIIAPNQRLMEVKIANAMPLWLSQKLSELQIYKVSFSKYGTAYARHVRNELYLRSHFLRDETPVPARTARQPVIRKTDNPGFFHKSGIALP